ncbi:MAG: hypothetical protein K8S16_02670 [Bacteroidales bacterium]|nr:hypothetical protein [Bacteroidales bacterium]
MKNLLVILLIVSISINLSSQESSKMDSIKNSVEVSRISDFGFGMGFDYGGLAGLKMSISPFDHFLLFGSAGYLPAAFGLNFGAAVHVFPKNSKYAIRPYFKTMYGINAYSHAVDAPEYTKNFHGVTIGLGVEFRFGNYKSHGINLDLNYPIKDEAYYELMDEIRADPYVEIKSEPGPIAISIGYHFEF